MDATLITTRLTGFSGDSFLSPFWGYGYSDDAAGADDGMGFQLGALLIMLFIASSGCFGALIPASRTSGRLAG